MVGGSKLVRMPVVVDVVSIYVLEVHSVWRERVEWFGKSKCMCFCVKIAKLKTKLNIT